MSFMPLHGETVLEQHGLLEAELRDAQTDAAHAALQFIDNLIFTDSFHEVCESFGGAGVDNTQRDSRLAAVGRLASRFLDFRQGKPRAEAPKPNLTDWQETALVKLGDELGMTRFSTAFKQPADVLMPHGSYRTGIYERLLWTREHIDVLTDRFPDVKSIVVGATSERGVTDGDKAGPFSFAPYARTERQIMDGGFETLLQAKKSGNFGDYEQVTKYALPNGLTGLTLSAPMIEGSRLPNTADTHIFTAQVLGAEALLGADIVGITTQVYVPFQEADMHRIFGLRYGARVQMVGYRDAAITQPQHIGQEFKAAIDQATKLHQAIKELQSEPKGVK